MDKGWIGVDLDGTLAKDTPNRLNDTIIGEPIPVMVERVKQHLENGEKVKIFTARANPSREDGTHWKEVWIAIDGWIVKHIGKSVPITWEKDHDLLYFYDDKAIPVEYNTGKLRC